MTRARVVSLVDHRREQFRQAAALAALPMVVSMSWGRDGSPYNTAKDKADIAADIANVLTERMVFDDVVEPS